MRTVRNAGIVALVVALLAVASIRIWTSESQVRRRVLAALEPFVAGPIVVRGATADLLRGLRIDELEIPAHPRVRAETLAQLIDIRLGRGGTLREGEGWVATVRRGELSIERGIDGHWNFEGVFKPGLPLSSSGGIRVLSFEESLLLRVEAIEAGGPAKEEVLRLSDLRISRRGGGALILSALAHHPYWKEATVQAEYEAAAARWRLAIEVDSLRASGDELARWLPSPLSDLPWQGIVDARFDLETARTSPLSIRGEIVHYDGRLKLPPPLPPLEHLAGRIRVERDSSSIARARGSIAGTDASVLGDLWRSEKGAVLRLEFGSLSLSSLGSWSADPRLTAWLERAAPLGAAQGTLQIRDLLSPDPAIEGAFSGSARSAIGVDSLEAAVEIGSGIAVHLRSARILGVPIGEGDGRLDLRDEGAMIVFPRIEVPGGGAELAIRLASVISPPGLSGSLRAERLALSALLEGLGVRAAEVRGDLSLTAEISEPNGLAVAGEVSGGEIAVRGLEPLKGLPPDTIALLEEPLSVRLSFVLGREGFRARAVRLAAKEWFAFARIDAGEDGAWSASLLLVRDADPAGAPVDAGALRAWVGEREPAVFSGRGTGTAILWEPETSEGFWKGFGEGD
ncbi:MAG: hypothetical protein JXP34_16600 [Planctomycetes bacterium]|nr:hypothetical protein [Planctomycetota bacterium]